MIHALTYSIVQHIKNEMPELSDVVWMRDGIELTSKERPFVVVKYMDDDSRRSSVGRDDYTETYTYQIGLRGTEFGLPRETEKLKTVLRKAIDFYDTTKPPPASVSGVFYFDNVDATVIPWSSELNHESDQYRVEIDCDITVYRKNGEYQFNI